MKYKFHEIPPDYDILEEEEINISFDKKERTFTKEINWIAKNLNLDVNKFKIDDRTFGDPVIFYQGKYMGYIFSDFYDAMDNDDFKSWWWELNN